MAVLASTAPPPVLLLGRGGTEAVEPARSFLARHGIVTGGHPVDAEGSIPDGGTAADRDEGTDEDRDAALSRAIGRWLDHG